MELNNNSSKNQMPNNILPNSNHPKKKIIIIDVDTRTLLIRQIKIAKSLFNNYNIEFLIWDITGDRPKIEYIEGFKVNNFRLKSINTGIIMVVFGYLMWFFYVISFLLKKDTDIYHTVNLYNTLPVIPVKIIKKKKMIYDIADCVADSYNWPTFIRKLLTRLENFSLYFVDGVIIVDEHRKKQVNISKAKNLAIVMNCPLDLMNDLDTKREQNMFIVYCGGWISETRGLRHICKAVKDLKGVKLVIAGFGPDEAKLKSIFDAQNNIEFIGLISGKESLNWTSKADVIFASYDPLIPINRLASPNKLFDSLMCKTPIVANSEAIPVALIVQKEKCGLLVRYEDIQGIRDTINMLKEDSNLRIEMGQNGRKAFEREYNWTIMEYRLLKLYSVVDIA